MLFGPVSSPVIAASSNSPILIVDYGMGSLGSVRNMLKRGGLDRQGQVRRCHRDRVHERDGPCRILPPEEALSRAGRRLAGGLREDRNWCERSTFQHSAVLACFIPRSWEVMRWGFGVIIRSVPRRHGRCARGERLRIGEPHGHWRMTTLPSRRGCRHPRPSQTRT